ncbi:MAG: hypothetical protein AMJ55_09565 [Gammaproteobacteria bacterium SG8_15]|nr:MAG: hypothetical protein AMJ55_09565 [Gammaproteobacteria bacterium SG8_15]
MDSIQFRLFFLVMSIVLCSTAKAAQGSAMNLMYEFQIDQLMEPSEEQLKLEQDGYVFIYDGLKDSDIQLALDKYQDRMGSMMFINVVWTDETGKPLVDPYSGQPVTDDDC